MFFTKKLRNLLIYLLRKCLHIVSCTLCLPLTQNELSKYKVYLIYSCICCTWKKIVLSNPLQFCEIFKNVSWNAYCLVQNTLVLFLLLIWPNVFYLENIFWILYVYLVLVEGLSVALQMLFLFVGVFIVAAKRTPFGTYGGVLKDHSATDLAEHAAKAALAAGGVAPELVNSVIVGNVMQVQ